MPEPQQAPSPIVLKFPAGLDNRSRETALPEGTLRDCVNMDVTREGTLLTRKGLRLLTAGDFHSFYSPPHGRFALVVKDGNLCRWDGSTFTVLRAANGLRRMSYASLNDEVFFSDGLIQGRVTTTGALDFWGLSTPPSPTCGAVSTGGMTAGTVRVTLTALSGHLESGAPEPVALTLADGGGVVVAVPTGATFRVYVTDVDGDIFRAVVDVASGSSVPIGVGYRGKPLESLGAVRPYPGQYVTAYKGRLWIASGSTVWFTDTLSPHWLVPNEGYFSFESPITMLGAAEDGLFVGTADRVYYLQGTKPADMNMRPTLHIGAIPGSGLNDMPMDVLLGQGSFPTRCCSFVDTDGVFCIGRPGGIVQRITDDRYVAGNARQADLRYVQHDGLSQFLALLDDEYGNANAAIDTAVVAINSNGTTL